MTNDFIPFDPDFDAPKIAAPHSSFFDGFSSKGALVFGLVVAIGTLSIIGSIVLLVLF